MGWCTRTRKLLIAAVCCLVVAFILAVVGFATPNWSEFTRRISYADGTTTYKQNAGLWQICSHILDTSTCTSRQNTPDWFQAVQILMSLAILGLIVSLVLSVLILCCITNKIVKIVNIVIIALSGLFIIVSVILYGTKNDDFSLTTPSILRAVVDVDSDHEYGYSYILCYIADFFLFLIVISLFVSDCRSYDDRDRNVHFYERDPSNVPFEYRHNVRIREVQPRDKKYYQNSNSQPRTYPGLYSDSPSSRSSHVSPYSRSYLDAPPSSRSHTDAPPSYNSYSDPRTQISYIAGNSQVYDGRGEPIPFTGRDHWSYDDAMRRYKY